MAISTTDKIALGQLGLQGVQGLVGGLDNSGEKNTAQNRDDELFNLLLQAVANQGNVSRGISQDNSGRAINFADANPLGGEFNFRRDNATKRAGIEALGSRQLAHGTPNIGAGFMDRPGVREAYSDNAVNNAIQQRRIATAGIDPRAAREIGGTNGFASQLFGELQNDQQAQRDSANQAYDMISGRMAQSQAQPEEKHGSKWKTFAKYAIPIAAAAAAPFTGGGSLGLLALGAGAGAATGALDGGWKGAGIGAATGGATGYLGSKLGVGKDDPGVILNNKMTSASLPTSMLNAAVQAPGAGQLQLPSSPNGGMGGGFMKSIGMDRPQVQSPQRTPAPPLTSLNNVNMKGLSNSIPYGFNIPQFPSEMAKPNPGLNRYPNTEMPLVQSGLGYVPNNQRFMETIGNTDPQSQLGRGAVSGAVGGAAYLGAPMLAGASSVTSPAGLLGSGNSMTQLGRVSQGLPGQAGQRLIGAGQRLLPQVAQSSNPEAQGIVAKLMEVLKAYKDDPNASRQIIEMMQPYLKQIP